jgi:hypothetical protein
MRLALFVGLTALLAVAACAVSLTLTGPSGLVTLPTAAVVAPGQLVAALDYYNTDDDATIPLRVTYGIAPGWEAGARYAINDTANVWAVNAKYLTPLSIADFRLAAGAQYSQSDASPSTQVTQAYLTGTRTLLEAKGKAPAVTGTLAANWTKVAPGTNGVRAALGLQADCSLTHASVIAEYQTKSSRLGEADPVWSLAARYPATPQLTVQAGLTNGALLAQKGSNLFVGASYAFETAAE